MFKWVSWVIRMGATALLLSFLCIWTTGYIVNSYMETVIKQLDLPLDTQPFALSGMWGTLWGAEKSPQAEASASKEATDKRNVEENKEIETESPDDSIKEPEASSSPSTPDSVNENSGAAPVKDAAAEPDDEASPNPESGEDVDSIPVFNGQSGGSQLTDSQRQALYAMVVSKLNQDQLKQLSESLQGGLTAEELVQVQNMLKSSLNEGEYSQMMELLQGKAESDTDALSE